MAAFIDASSGIASSAGTNDNLYYVNAFSIKSVEASTGTFLTNAGGQVSAAVEADITYSGACGVASRFAITESTFVGFRDLTDAFRSISEAGAEASFAAVVTAGTQARSTLNSPVTKQSAKWMRQARRGGVAIAGVVVGGRPQTGVRAVVDTAVDGAPLLFLPTVYTRTSQLLTSALLSVGAIPGGAGCCAACYVLCAVPESRCGDVRSRHA